MVEPSGTVCFSRLGDQMKLCLVSSSGGHLLHLNLMKRFWEKYDRGERKDRYDIRYGKRIGLI